MLLKNSIPQLPDDVQAEDEGERLRALIAATKRRIKRTLRNKGTANAAINQLDIDLTYATDSAAKAITCRAYLTIFKD